MIFFVSMVLRKICWHPNGEYIILGQAVFLKLAKILLKILLSGLEIKKIPKSPFGDQLEKYSRQMQIFSRQFV